MKHIVTLLLNDLCAGRLLTVHRNCGHDATGQFQQTQQLEHDRDFIGLGADFQLSDRHTACHIIGRENPKTTLVPALGTADGFPVNRYDIS